MKVLKPLARFIRVMSQMALSILPFFIIRTIIKRKGQSLSSLEKERCAATIKEALRTGQFQSVKL